MTRLEAIKAIRAGHILTKLYGISDGASESFELWIQAVKYCDFVRHKQYHHSEIGPIHVCFDTRFWLHISTRQLLGWIKRNYLRH